MKILTLHKILAKAALVLCLCATLPTYAQVKPLPFEKDVKGFDIRDSLEKTRPGSNLFVGSSSITYWKDVAAYFPNAYVINRAFGGSKFSDLLLHADRTIIAYKPAKIFVYEGDNDIASGIAIPVIMEQVKQLREKIAKDLPGVPVVFISVKPSVSRWRLKPQYEALNEALQKYCKEAKKTKFADVWTPMLDEKGEVFKHVFVGDNLHMNPEGYKIWQKVLTPFVLNKKGS